MLFWGSAFKNASELDIDEPNLPRQIKMPRRYDYGSSSGDFPSTIEDYYKQIYFEAPNLVTNGIEIALVNQGIRVIVTMRINLFK